jgi:hypothetical protein
MGTGLPIAFFGALAPVVDPVVKKAIGNPVSARAIVNPVPAGVC